MEWSSTAITWDMQLMIMWIILPTVFIICGFLTLVLPPQLAHMHRHRSHGSNDVSRHPVPETGS